MTFDQSRLVAGMDVVGPAGEAIGRVKDVRKVDFLLDLTMRRDIYVPFSAVREVGGSTVVLGIEPSELGNQGWEMAPLLGGTEESDSTAPPEDLVVGTGDPAERGTWSASSDSYDLEALDTRAGQLATSGTDDGEQPRSAELSPVSGITRTSTGSSSSTNVTETDRLRDLFG